MPRNIAVICASPPGFNAGMYSVDLAFRLLAQKYGFADRVQMVRLYPTNHSFPTEVESPYLTIPAADDFFQSQRAILYWGDFLHMRQYHKAVAKKLLDNQLSENLVAAEQRVREVFFLQGQADAVFEKSLSFGGTLLFNTIHDEMDAGYRTPLQKFLKLCKGVWFRDIYSALKACHIKEEYQPGCLGVDCANLIDPAMLPGFGITPKMDDTVGVFFGRTTNDMEGMLNFALTLTQKLGCQPAWLSWGDTRAFPLLASIYKLDSIRSFKFFTEEPIRDPIAPIRDLMKYKVIITDTYHVCVNAWNLGIPAICLVGNEFSPHRNVNFGDSLSPRDKRQVWMGMYDALDFFVAGDYHDQAFCDAKTMHLLHLIQSGTAINAICNRIRLHAKSAEYALVQEIQNLL